MSNKPIIRLPTISFVHTVYKLHNHAVWCRSHLSVRSAPQLIHTLTCHWKQHTTDKVQILSQANFLYKTINIINNTTIFAPTQKLKYQLIMR